MKQIIITFLILALSVTSFAQSNDVNAVKAVLKKYATSIEKLDTTGITNLFVKNASVYEGGSIEGTIVNYLEHHLGPELKEFKSFNFSDYNIAVTVTGDYAFTTETYIYTIVLAKDNKEFKSKGVATSILKKMKEGWKIVSTHSSFRKVK